MEEHHQCTLSLRGARTVAEKTMVHYPSGTSSDFVRPVLARQPGTTMSRG